MSSSTGIQKGFINQNVKNSGLFDYGLYYEIFDTYFIDNVDFFSTAKYLFPLGTSYGYSSDLTNLSYATNQKLVPNLILNNFSVQWTGYLVTPAGTSGTWTFSLRSDDSSYFWIGNNALSGFTTSNADINIRIRRCKTI